MSDHVISENAAGNVRDRGVTDKVNNNAAPLQGKSKGPVLFASSVEHTIHYCFFITEL